MEAGWQGAIVADQALLGQFQGANSNLSAIAKALTNAFVGNASHGTFSMPAAATTTVTDGAVKATSIILPIAVNAAAATLMGSAKALYATAAAAGGSFTAATASGTSAAGTEKFAYVVLNLS